MAGDQEGCAAAADAQLLRQVSRTGKHHEKCAAHKSTSEVIDSWHIEPIGNSTRPWRTHLCVQRSHSCERAFLAALLLALAPALAQMPAGNRPAQRADSGTSILPGGRLITPLGEQFFTGPGPFGLAISPSGQFVVSADGGPNRYALTVLDTRTLDTHMPNNL